MLHGDVRQISGRNRDVKASGHVWGSIRASFHAGIPMTHPVSSKYVFLPETAVSQGMGYST